MLESKQDPNSRQVGGQHYRKDPDYQHWDLIADNLGAAYFEAQITKYITRWRAKDGVKDAEKAIHYFEKLLHLYQHSRLALPRPPRNGHLVRFEHFSRSQQLTDEERTIFIGVLSYTQMEELEALSIPLSIILRKAYQFAGTENIQAALKSCACGEVNPPLFRTESGVFCLKCMEKLGKKLREPELFCPHGFSSWGSCYRCRGIYPQLLPRCERVFK